MRQRLDDLDLHHLSDRLPRTGEVDHPVVGGAPAQLGRIAARRTFDQHLLAARAAVERSPVVPATSETERTLSRIFARVLGVHSIDIATNFFELGATSLKLMEAHASIARTWPEVEVLALFRHPTIRDLARALDGGLGSIANEAQRRARGQAAALQRLHKARPR